MITPAISPLRSTAISMAIPYLFILICSLHYHLTLDPPAPSKLGEPRFCPSETPRTRLAEASASHVTPIDRLRHPESALKDPAYPRLTDGVPPIETLLTRASSWGVAILGQLQECWTRQLQRRMSQSVVQKSALRGFVWPYHYPKHPTPDSLPGLSFYSRQCTNASRLFCDFPSPSQTLLGKASCSDIKWVIYDVMSSADGAERIVGPFADLSSFLARSVTYTSYNNTGHADFGPPAGKFISYLLVADLGICLVNGKFRTLRRGCGLLGGPPVEVVVQGRL